jgi:hypothetical protein
MRHSARIAKPAVDAFPSRATVLHGSGETQKGPLSERPPHWVRPELRREGNKWRALYGENPQDGVAGFGDTPDEAFADFDRLWFTHRGPSAFRGRVKA